MTTTWQILPACMGGWCISRDRCHQHVAADRTRCVERLCKPGRENERPVTVGEPVQPCRVQAGVPA